MNIGYSITSAHPRDRPARDVASDLILRAEVARDAGFEYVQAGDHHLMHSRQYFQNIPTVARLTETFDHAAALFVLPLYDPLSLAEQIGTLDAFVDKFDFWCALGWRQKEYQGLGIPMTERVPRFEEGLALLRKLWSVDSVTFDGDFYETSGVSVNPKAAPARICIGGSREPAVRRAGRLGDAWVAAPTETAEEIRRKKSWFTDGGGGDLIVRRDALVLADGTRASERADNLLSEGYRGWDTDAPVLAGDAAAVADELAKLADLGVSDVVIRPMSPEHSHEILRETARARDLL